MAKRVKEDLSWLAINVDTLPKTLQTKHATIRGLFDQLKTAKAAFESECDALLVKIAGAMPADAQEKLRIEDGKFPAKSVRKFSYMRGIAVATASAPKSAAGKGIALS